MTETAPGPDIFGSTIFCDDIRFEMDGKVSYIGAYTGVMFVRDGFPIILPKFGLGIQFVQKVAVFKPNLLFKVFLPGDADDSPSIVYDLTPANQLEPRAEGQFLVVRANFVLSPLEIKQPGHLQVRVERDGILYRCGALRIEQSPAGVSDPSATASQPTA
jgi:hypothetical protein